LIVIEIKVLQAIAPVHLRQVRTYLTLSGCPLELLMNFGEETMKDGVHRVVNNFPEGTRRDLPARRSRAMGRKSKIRIKTPETQMALLS
jgi:hypothetical protein